MGTLQEKDLKLGKPKKHIALGQFAAENIICYFSTFKNKFHIEERLSGLVWAQHEIILR